MKQFKIGKKVIFEWGKVPAKPEALAVRKPVVLPTRRQSDLPSTHTNITYLLDGLREDLKVLEPEFQLDTIPLIRKLVRVNPNMGEALNNIVQLGNTGHEIYFDDKVTPENINEMRQALKDKKETWCKSQPNMDGLVNKMISQLIIGGASCTEWVPEMDLSGVRTVVLVNPEEIRWAYDQRDQEYRHYQKVNPTFKRGNEESLRELNPNTFRYYALNGDTEIPYGFPPYLAALDSVAVQKNMLDNIKFIVETIGVMGFLEVLVEKPAQEGGESPAAYITRLEKLLSDTKNNLALGLKEGISVGYKDDTEYNFHATTRNIEGLDSLYTLNEINMMTGLKQDPALMGRAYSTTETQINIVFTKLLSEIKNIQGIIQAALEFGYALHLRLQGYDFKNLSVKFNPSTALDRFKEAQADEIEIRNSNALYNAGIISQNQYAHRHGLATPDEKEPRYVATGAITPAEAKEQREKKKDASDRRVREKNKPGSAAKNKMTMTELLGFMFYHRDQLEEVISQLKEQDEA